ncbi:MAG: HTH domain-containing protein [Candidatus Lokiarchaeota archaeon]|nr:HTH domain-containing protein [Candidatus Lokiarchaeota archaeon]
MEYWIKMSNKFVFSDESEILSKRELILNKIKESTYGINISQIARDLKMHRITVKNYIEDLKKENLVVVKKIGRSKICYTKDQELTLNRFEFLVMEFLGYFFESFEDVVSESLDDSKNIMKKIGKALNKHIKFPELKISNSIDLLMDKRVSLDKMADVGLTILKLINIIGKKRGYEELVKAKKVEFIEDEKQIAISLKTQFFPFEFLNTGLLYYLGAGFFEAILQDNYGEIVHVNVHMIPPEKYICYYKIGIK